MKNKVYILLFSLLLFSACSRKQYVSKTPERIPSIDTVTTFKLPVDTLYKEQKTTPIQPQINPEIYYVDAFNDLKKMLEDKQSLSFKKAVFITENAYFEDKLDYTKFCNYISSLSTIAKKWTIYNKLKDYKFIDSTNTALNAAIFYTLTDTVFDKNKLIVNTPYRYDFNDCFAKENWTNMFVTKLMLTHKGNCHSLPFLYKIVAEELNVKVWLSYTPNHIYLRNRCKKTGWYNTEMTNAMFPTEAWVMTSGYVSVNSIVSGIYMDTLGLKQSVAVCVNDLAKGYQRKFKNADLQFVLNCCELGLNYYPNFAELLLLKAETLKNVYENDISKYGLNAPQSELHSEKIKQTLNEMEQTYALLAKLDYRELPEQMYFEWMKSLKDNKEKYENKEIIDTFKTENKTQ